MTPGPGGVRLTYDGRMTTAEGSTIPNVALNDGHEIPLLGLGTWPMNNEEAARSLAEKGLFLSHGDFYAWTVVQRYGLEPEGFIRAGCACYTSEEEIERLIEGVRELC